jgi:hypothetical protein
MCKDCEKYALIIIDKFTETEGNTVIYGSNLQRLEFQGMENVQIDRKNITAKVWALKDGKIDGLMADCNLLLESYEGK